MGKTQFMDDQQQIWLASYPRSGNTFLRTILWHCFELRTASIYPNDLNGNRKLEQYVGHIETPLNTIIKFPEGNLPIIKTHKLVSDDWPAIYVVRDGRAASISLWKFYDKTVPLQVIIEGEHQFGTWCNHVNSWHPWDRDKTLFIKYEDLVGNLPAVLVLLREFLNREIIKTEVPDRNAIAGVDGRWVKQKSDWRDDFSEKLLARFYEINGEMMKKLGYLD